MRLRSSLLSICLLPCFLFGQQWYQIKTNFSGIAAEQYLPEINTMLIDREGREWYGSDGGLSTFYKGRWTTYTPENSDIPFRNVLGLDEDADGNLYVAAQEGLFRNVQDGWEELSWQVPYNGVNDIIAITQDSFFVASNNGFHKYVDGNWTLDTYTTLPSRVVRRLEKAADGTIWATFDYARLNGDGPLGFDGFGQYDGNNWIYNIRDILFAISGTPFPAGFRDIAIDTSGKIWAASAKKGLFIMDLQDTSFVHIDESTAPFWNNTLLSIDIDSANQVWIGAQTELLHYDPVQNQYESISGEESPFAFTRYRQLYRAPDGALWTVANGEVGRLNIEDWEVKHSFVSDGLHGNRVWDIECQQDGSCLLGLEDRGAALVADGRWQASLLQENTYLENEARDFAVGPNGEVYIASQNGIYYYEENTFTHLEGLQQLLPYPIVTAIEYDAERGGLWIGTNGSRALGNDGSGQDNAGGLAFYNLTTGGWNYYTPMYMNEFASYNHGYHIWALALDDQGRLWVGSTAPTNPSYGILSFYDGNNWQTFNRLQHTNLPGITKLEAAPGGGVWFAGSNGGFGFTEDCITVETHTPTFPNGNPVAGYRAIHYDRDQEVVYLGTSYPTGLLKFDGQNYDWLDLSNSPLNLDFGINAIDKDQEGNLWLANPEEGLFLYNPTGVVFPDRVWPGDSNSDGYVNMDDVLSLGLAMGKAGVARANASIYWEPQIAENWPTSYPDGLNHKHADCDGNGLVDQSDLEVINENYTAIHPLAKGLTPAPLPSLRLEFSHDSLPANGKILANVVLGSNEAVLTNLHGIRFTLTLDQRFENIGDLKIASKEGWLLDSGNSLELTREGQNQNEFQIGLSRIDQIGQSGQGIVAQLEWTLPHVNVDDFAVSISAALGITADGLQMPAQSTAQTIVVSDQISSSYSITENPIKLYPTLLPVGQSEVFLEAENWSGQLLLFSSNGRLVRQYPLQSKLALQLPQQGLYFYQVMDTQGNRLKAGKLLVH